MRATRLLCNRVDLARLSAIEYPRGGRYSIAPDVVAASCGPVDSGALFAKRQPEEIQTVALDTPSRTAAALTRILCSQK